MPEGDGPMVVGDVAAATLEVLFTQSPAGLVLLDSQLRIVGVNTGTGGMTGRRAEDFLGRHVLEAFDVADATRAEATFRAVLETGAPVRDRVFRVRLWQDPTREFTTTASVFRLQDPRGEVLQIPPASEARRVVVTWW
jgi:PAS domain S-box-containing protein